MIRTFLVLAFVALASLVFSQKKVEKGRLGITIPVTWNTSEATFYQLGNAQHPSGSAMSYGIGVTYLQPLKGKFFAKLGAGYFRQSFKLTRPFNFDDPTRLLFSTKSYFYDNIYWTLGLGYYHKIQKNTKLKGGIEYFNLNSYRQNYKPEYLSNSSYQTSQNNKLSMNIGSMINIDLGIEKKVSHKLSIGTDLILPVYTKWKNDTEFPSQGYSADEQQIAQNKFSIGLAVSCYYHF